MQVTPGPDAGIDESVGGASWPKVHAPPGASTWSQPECFTCSGRILLAMPGVQRWIRGLASVVSERSEVLSWCDL